MVKSRVAARLPACRETLPEALMSSSPISVGLPGAERTDRVGFCPSSGTPRHPLSAIGEKRRRSSEARTPLFALAGLFALVLPAAAESGSGCAPLGTLPGYKWGDKKRLAYEGADFKVMKGEETATVTVKGRYCSVSAEVEDGKPPMADTEIQSNFRRQLAKLGAKITLSDDGNTYAELQAEKTKTWFYVYSQSNAIQQVVVVEGAPVVTLTAPAKGDYRLLGHMPNYKADPAITKAFDKVEFKLREGDEEKTVPVQGKSFLVGYDHVNGRPTASPAEIQFNYRDALAKLGAQIVSSDDQNTVARLVDKGQTVWIKIYSQESSIGVTAVEEKPFKPSLQPPRPDAMKAALEKTGRVTLYVNFDFGAARLRPDAAPIVGRVLDLLKKNAGLSLSIEGHTDNVGKEAFNQKLSRARAAAIVEALVAKGIAADRLVSEGFGASKPITTNDTSEGRAKNRRVELVKR